MRIIVATDSSWIVDTIVAALGDDDTSFTICREGRDVSRVVQQCTEDVSTPDYDLAVLDLQIGSMGGMAVTMALRLDASAGMLPHVPVLMLLDRTADVHLARRSGAEGWIVKPLDARRLSRAAAAVVGGGAYHNGPVRPEVIEEAPASAS